MSTEPDSKNKSDENGCLTPIIFWSCVLGVLYVLELVDKDSPGRGRELFGWIVGLCALGIFAYIVWDKTIIKTAKNIATIAKWLAIVIVVSLFLGGLSRCAGISHDVDERDVGGVPNNWRR